jgi:hypothetical protein
VYLRYMGLELWPAVGAMTPNHALIVLFYVAFPRATKANPER